MLKLSLLETMWLILFVSYNLRTVIKSPEQNRNSCKTCLTASPLIYSCVTHLGNLGLEVLLWEPQTRNLSTKNSGLVYDQILCVVPLLHHIKTPSEKTLRRLKIYLSPVTSYIYKEVLNLSIHLWFIRHRVKEQKQGLSCSKLFLIVFYFHPLLSFLNLYLLILKMP